MARIALCLLALLVLSSARDHEERTTIFEKNYEGFKSFVSGFMQSYTGQTFDLPESCFDESTQQKLDNTGAALFQYLVIFNMEGFFTNMHEFALELGEALKACDMNQVGTSLTNGVAKNGVYWPFTNIAFHFFKIEEALQKGLINLANENWKGCGQKVGEAVSLVIPMDLSAIRYNPLAIGDIFEGFLLGLQKSPTALGSCGTFIVSTEKQYNTVKTDFEDVATKGWDAVPQFLQDSYYLYSTLRGYDGWCHLGTLWTRLVELAGAEGGDILVAHYVTHFETIDHDLDVIEGGCSQDYVSCGKAAGEIFRLLVDWTINQNIK